ncbi:MAG: hypothetical protein ABIJ16_10510 [Bacteroidota bacterium]
MKTFRSIVLLILLGNLSFAQVATITETNQILQVGDTIRYFDADFTYFNPDGTGPDTNKLWNYVSLLGTGTEMIYWYLDPSGTPSGTMFPGATIAEVNSQDQGYYYYETNATQINRLGWYSDTTNYCINDVPSPRFHFPISRGGGYNGTYTGNFSPLYIGEDSIKIESGQVTVTADMQNIMANCTPGSS